MEPRSDVPTAEAGEDPHSAQRERNALAGWLRANPRDAAAWARLAELESRRGRLETARLCAEAAVSLEPADRRVRLVRAWVLAASADFGERGRYELAELSLDLGPRAPR